MYFVPACRNVACFAAACFFSFLNGVVIHNHLHQGIFTSRRLNLWFRGVLSFGALYPVTANVAAHNLVHHHFDDGGRPDWVAPGQTQFRWNLMNLIHFPNIVGTITFAGVHRWLQLEGRLAFRRQYVFEQAVAFGVTGALLVLDFWPGLFFVVLPQLFGARWILRMNLIQHEGCDLGSEWNHSRNFTGRAYNWIMCNNGYHTIHHNRAGLHWSEWAAAHAREVAPRIDPSLNERSMTWYLVRTYLLQQRPPAPARRSTTEPFDRAARRLEAEATAVAETVPS
jgi:fatty acid desaturase